MSFQIFNPDDLGRPRGFSHGLAWTGEGRLLFVAGQTALDENGSVVSADFTEQFALCLDRILAVVAEAGGTPEHIGRMIIWVTDMGAYREARGALAGIWRDRMGSHYPAMALAAVSELVDEGARVEIQATAVVP